MPRRRTPLSTDYPFHITARTNNRERFPGKLDYVWRVFSNELWLQAKLYALRIHAFVLMPNHFHLLASSPEREIGLCMREFLSSSTRIINAKNQRTGRVFGGPYSGSLIQDPYYFLHAYKYVIRNPARAKLCSFVGQYAFSTYACSIGLRHLPIPLCMPEWNLAAFLPQDAESMDLWLNKPHRSEENEALRKALRRKEFSMPAHRSSRRADWFEL